MPIEASLAYTPTIINNCPGLKDTLPEDWPLSVNNNSIPDFIELISKKLNKQNYGELAKNAHRFAFFFKYDAKEIWRTLQKPAKEIKYFSSCTCLPRSMVHQWWENISMTANWSTKHLTADISIWHWQKIYRILGKEVSLNYGVFWNRWII